MTRASHDTRDQSTRTCVVCRGVRSPAELLRVGEINGCVIVGRPPQGRAAHVCVARDCLHGLSGPALSRGLRRAVKVDAALFLQQLHQLAERRVLEMVGLARRQRGLAIGVEKTAGPGLVLIASDLAERSRRAAGEEALEFIDGAALGRAAGSGWLGAVRIEVESLAEQAAYWLALWYESRSVAVGETPELPTRAATTGS